MPHIFIASSTGCLNEARAIKQVLKDDVDITIWDEGIFKLSSFILEVLEKAAKEFDFGIFVMGPDDFRQKNKGPRKSIVPRDNVVFECGLFIGSLGRKRSFIVIPRGIGNLELPTDLQGLVFSSYSVDTNGTPDFSNTRKEVMDAINTNEWIPDDQLHVLGRTSARIDPETGTHIWPNDQFSQIHYKGRLAPIYTGRFLESAQSDITIAGLSLRSFISYFESRPYEEVKKPVIEAIKRGVMIKLLFLDPHSYFAKNYLKEANNKELLGQIKSSLEKAVLLKDEFSTYSSQPKFEIRLMTTFPFGQMKRVDGNDEKGKFLGYHYLMLDQRPKSPYFEIYKKTNPLLYSVYNEAVNQLVDKSILI